MGTAKFAVFVDLENCGAKVDTLSNILEKVKIRGDILLGKVYGYSDRFSDLKEILLSNTFTVVPSLRYGAAQKNNADIMLVIDALTTAYSNPLIDSFCIVSGDSDYVPLVGTLKSLGKFVLGISRSEVASSIFINACNEFQFLETVGVSPRRPVRTKNRQSVLETEPDDEDALCKLIEGILSEAEEDEMYASELKGVLLRLRPQFNEKNYGCGTFGKLLSKLSSKYGTFRMRNDSYNVMVSLVPDQSGSSQPEASPLTNENWQAAFSAQLQRYKDDGFERINPSILKADITSAYPDFSEKSIGFRRFSDILKQLEKDGYLKLEMDSQRNMLVKML